MFTWILFLSLSAVLLAMIIYYLILKKRRLWPIIPCMVVIVFCIVCLIGVDLYGEDIAKQSKVEISYSYDLMVTKIQKDNEYYLTKNGEDLQYSYIDADYTPWTKTVEKHNSKIEFSEYLNQPYVIIRKIKSTYYKRWLFLIGVDKERIDYEYEFHITSKGSILKEK